MRSIVAVVALVALLGGAVAAAAEAPTRTEYVRQLESVCRPDVAATEVAMRGVRADIRAERLRPAARKFAKATRIFAGTVKDMAAFRRPPADTARLAKWFVYLKRQRSYLRRITRQLRAGRAIKAQRLTARFIHNGNLANNAVLPFGFDYCSFKFSRYG